MEASQLVASVTGGAADVAVPNQFPAGLRVLVVDDDLTCLKILEQMLRRCLYHVTTFSQATVALKCLRERKGCFDVVLSDVHMPDMDGFKLLEHVGLEMDLPVIMMSIDGRTSVVMKGIRHGACDYLIKPIRKEELKNIWQHVIRKKWNEDKELEHSGNMDDNDQQKRGDGDAECASSVNEGTEVGLRGHKKRNNANEDDSEQENNDPSTSKKPRVVWSVELHQQFVSAVNQLGIDKAVPKRILELMNVHGLTRENVASHLQKFRLYLKRISGVAQQGGLSNAFCGPLDSNVKSNMLGRFDIQGLAASCHLPPQTLAALHAELLGQPTGSLVTAMEQPAFLQASTQGLGSEFPVQHSVAFGPVIKCPSNISKHFSQNMVCVEDPSGNGSWPSDSLSTVTMEGVSSNPGVMSARNSSVLMDIFQQQQYQQQQQQSQQQLSISEISRSINVQPSCLVVPSLSSSNFQAVNSPASVNQNGRFNRSSTIDYSLLSPQSGGHVSKGDLKTSGVVSGFTGPGSVSPASSCSVNFFNTTTQHIQNSTLTFRATRQLPGFPNVCDTRTPFGANSGKVLDQGSLENLGFVGTETFISSQFAEDDFESPMSNLCLEKFSVENSLGKVKQEPNMEFIDNACVGIPRLQQFPPE